MKKTNLNKLSDVIKGVMSNPKIRRKMEELDVLEVWEDLLGNNLNKYVKETKIYNKVLYVKFHFFTLRNELKFQKKEMIEKINEQLGKSLIKDIIFK